MSPLEVPAFGRERLVAVVAANHAGIVVRLDGWDRPDFWAEVRLTHEQLACLLESVPPTDEQIANLRSEVEAWRDGDFTEEVSVQPLPPPIRRGVMHGFCICDRGCPYCTPEDFPQD